jgi:hypothetical protein
LGQNSVNQNLAPETPWAAPGIEAEIPEAWGISQKSPAEELEQKARFFAKQKRRPKK